jgi:hypothetical protein
MIFYKIPGRLSHSIETFLMLKCIMNNREAKSWIYNSVAYEFLMVSIRNQIASPIFNAIGQIVITFLNSDSSSTVFIQHRTIYKGQPQN